ncbi:hypothetical protein CONPUDRAFT_155469 [Coniophora puteana RWD-64-598 SS2]|uniref:Uncharacterized protein n=1 Tax=Coniophora puteana (strain RWD-64-598) TaxID=741705 RepID=A0A5M3MMV1_CONPW|nr:uncharacterized protein CONPUDRAFT_155469 [Coniophora puteana RWD-64-598 SS2]EIW80104.1 hypothetical protein CONPUDRAFT_155469 [Coniophora puteana RWD-64-598 SS2]
MPPWSNSPIFQYPTTNCGQEQWAARLITMLAHGLHANNNHLASLDTFHPLAERYYEPHRMNNLDAVE